MCQNIEKTRLRVVKIVAALDIGLALIVACYATFQFSHGKDLIPGDKLTDAQKVTRLTIYATLNYSFLLLQTLMGIMLFISACNVLKDPMRNIEKFKSWRSWSGIYMIFLLIDVFVVSLLMTQANALRNDTERKVVSLTLLLVQIVFRPLGITIIKKVEFLFLHDMATSFSQSGSL